MRSTLPLALVLATGCTDDPASTVRSGLDVEDPGQEFELTFTEEGGAERTVHWAPDDTTHTRLVAADQCNSITCDEPTFYIEGNLLDGPAGSHVIDPRIHVAIETAFPPAAANRCGDGARMLVRFRAHDLYTSSDSYNNPSPGTSCLVELTLAEVGELVEGTFSGELLHDPTSDNLVPNTATSPFSGRFRIIRDAESPNGG